MSETVKPFRAYDAQVLTDTYNVLSQMQQKIEGLIATSENIKDSSDLPNSLVPTNTLYSIALCYTAIYELLLADHLIKNGHHKISTKTLH